MSAENENNAKPKSVAEIVADLRKAALLGLPIDPEAVAARLKKPLSVLRTGGTAPSARAACTTRRRRFLR